MGLVSATLSQFSSHERVNTFMLCGEPYFSVREGRWQGLASRSCVQVVKVRHWPSAPKALKCKGSVETKKGNLADAISHCL